MYIYIYIFFHQTFVGTFIYFITLSINTYHYVMLLKAGRSVYPPQCYAATRGGGGFCDTTTCYCYVAYMPRQMYGIVSYLHYNARMTEATDSIVIY